MESTTTPIFILPGEVLDLVCRHCSLAELKSLRLCCKRLMRVSEPHLFKTVVLVPHTDSFESLQALSEHARLRHHVQGLVYDPRDVVDELHFCVPNDWPTHQSFQIQHHVSEFASILRSLPRLEKVHMQTDSLGQRPPEPPAFYTRISKRREIPIHLEGYGATFRKSNFYESPAIAIFSALVEAGKSINDLSLQGVGMGLLSNTSHCHENQPLVPDELLDPVLSSTRRLDIRFVGLCQKRSQNALFHSRLRATLSRKENLESFGIQLHDWYVWRSIIVSSHQEQQVFGGLSPSSFFGPKSHYPKLKSLSIQNYMTYEMPWLAFLMSIAPTLQSLKLKNFGICDDRGLREPLLADGHLEPTFDHHVCLVHLLKQMKSILNLESIEFSGTLVSVGIKQVWAITNKSISALEHEDTLLLSRAAAAASRKPRPCLKTRVIDWFINGGKCPLEVAAFKSSPTDLELPDPDLKEWWWGDSSWRIKDNRDNGSLSTSRSKFKFISSLDILGER